MQHMQKLPAHPNCRNHLFVLSSSFAACVNNAKLQKVLQVRPIAAHGLFFGSITVSLVG